MGRRGLVTAREHTRIRDRFSQYAIETFRGTASFVDPHTLRVAGARRLRPGDPAPTSSSSPPAPAPSTRPTSPSTTAAIYDSDSILMLDRVPRSLAVLGGGVAGSEYTSAFAALGVHVTMADSRDRVMPFLDAELSHELERLWTEFGVEIKHRTRVTKVEPGDRDVLVTLSDGSRTRGREGAGRRRPHRQHRGARPRQRRPPGRRARLPQGERALPDRRCRTSTRPATWWASPASPPPPWSRGAWP